MRTPEQQRSGVTLIEIMISLILVSTVLLVSLTASANLLRNSAVQRAAADAEGLANQILDEISALDFRDREDPVFGLESTENAADRTTYDDVDDYHGYVASPPSHRDGTPIEGYTGWSFSVSILSAEPDATGIVTSNDDQQPLRVITVNCTAPDGTVFDESTLVAEVPSDIPDSTSYHRWRQIKLQFPSRDLTVTSPLRNHPDAY